MILAVGALWACDVELELGTVADPGDVGAPGAPDGGAVDGAALGDAGPGEQGGPGGGTVIGVLRRAGEATHDGSTLEIAGQIAFTDVDGRFRFEGVRAGVYTLRASFGPAPVTTNLSGRVRPAVAGVTVSPLYAHLQIVPITWDPLERFEVTVLAGQVTEVAPLRLDRTAPYVRSAAVDPAGMAHFSEVPVGRFEPVLDPEFLSYFAGPSGSASVDPEVDFGIGSWSLVAGSDHQLSQVKGLRDLAMPFVNEERDEWISEPELDDLALEVSPGAILPEGVVYPVEAVDLHEAPPSPTAGLNFATRRAVRVGEGGADFFLEDPRPLAFPGPFELQVMAPAGEWWAADPAPLSQLRAAPPQGYTARLGFELGHDEQVRIESPTLVLRQGSRHTKVRFFIQETTTITGYRRAHVAVLYYGQDGPTFQD